MKLKIFKKKKVKELITQKVVNPQDTDKNEFSKMIGLGFIKEEVKVFHK
jgi:carbamate kinase